MEGVRNTYDVRVRPGLPNGVGDRCVIVLHQLEVLVPRFLAVRLENTAGNKIVLHLSVVPSGVDVVLRIVESLPCAIGTGRNQARDRVGDGARERRAGVLVGIVVVLCEADQLLLGAFRFHDPLFGEEIAEARLVPRLKGRVLEVLEGLLSVVVLFVGPRGVRPPVFGHEILEVLLRVVEGFRDIDLMLLEPGLQLFRIPFGVFWKGGRSGVVVNNMLGKGQNKPGVSDPNQDLELAPARATRIREEA